MREFFSGWRRKIGVATLIGACILAGMWARSLVVSHHLFVGPANRLYQVRLFRGSMAYARIDAPDWPGPAPLIWEYDEEPYELIYILLGEWEFDSFTWTIPLYAFIVPLTILSAYLIVWKPRKQQPTASKTHA